MEGLAFLEEDGRQIQDMGLGREQQQSRGGLGDGEL